MALSATEVSNGPGTFSCFKSLSFPILPPAWENTLLLTGSYLVILTVLATLSWGWLYNGKGQWRSFLKSIYSGHWEKERDRDWDRVEAGVRVSDEKRGKKVKITQNILHFWIIRDPKILKALVYFLSNWSVFIFTFYIKLLLLKFKFSTYLLKLALIMSTIKTWHFVNTTF